MEFKFFRSAIVTLQGIELVQMIKKGRMVLFIGGLKAREGSRIVLEGINATEPNYFNVV